jgi:hypothetical protein
MEDHAGTCPVEEVISVYAEARLLRPAIANKRIMYFFKRLPGDATFDLFLELVEWHLHGLASHAIRKRESAHTVGNLAVGYGELALIQTDDGRV